MPVPPPLEPFDVRFTAWMAKRAVSFARVSLGIVFVWFGALKFVPDLSPAEDLASRTLEKLGSGVVPPSIALKILATWETLIGVGLLVRRYLRLTLLLLWVQLLGTILPLFFFPEESFSVIPIAPTLEGQYIIKNLVLVSAALVIGATVRGGRLNPSPTPGASERSA
jgi:uncharacterized membrane protein YkgB